MQRKKVSIYDISINDDSPFSYLSNVDQVDNAAIERNFLLLNSDSNIKFHEVGEKRFVTGPALVPDRLIYRYDFWTDTEYYIRINKENIEKAVKNFFKNHSTHNQELNHIQKVQGIYLVESWIIQDRNNDKANALGFKDLVEGMWMVTQHVEDENIWRDYLKSGELRGYSIQGSFLYELTQEIDQPVRELLRKQHKPESDQLIQTLRSTQEKLKKLSI